MAICLKNKTQLPDQVFISAGKVLAVCLLVDSQGRPHLLFGLDIPTITELLMSLIELWYKHVLIVTFVPLYVSKFNKSYKLYLQKRV